MLAQQRLYAHRALATSLRERHGALRDQCQQARAAVIGEHTEAIAAVAALYLPSLDPASLAHCARLTGFRGFERRDPIAAREHERKVLQTSVRTSEDDPRFRDRQRLAGDRGELSTALTGAKDGLAQAQALCDRFESQLGFLELITAHYDTPQFALQWWHADYWKMWSAGDRICRDLGSDDFGDDVLPAYRRVAEPRDVWRAEVARLSAEVGAIHELVRRHDQAAQRLQQLDEIYLAQSRAYLGEHLAQADLGLLGEWCQREANPASEQIGTGLRRLAGIRSKLAYVGDIESGVDGVDTQLAQRIGKYDRKLVKADRGKHLSEAELADTLDQKAAALESQAEKTRQRLDRLVAARNYDSFDDRWDHHRWWWHFTQSPPTRLSPHTRTWYDAHPEVTVGLAADPDLAPEQRDGGVADAFMSSRDGESGGGYLS